MIHVSYALNQVSMVVADGLVPILHKTSATIVWVKASRRKSGMTHP